MVTFLHRRGFRFSLGSFLVVVTAICCGLGWQMNIVRQRQTELRAHKDELGIHLVTVDEYQAKHPQGSVLQQKAKVPLLRSVLGDTAVQEIWFDRYSDKSFSQERLDRLAKLFPEATLQEILLLPCHPGCFPVGTMVLTPSGQRPIESISQGDYVLIVDENGGSCPAAVQSIFSTQNVLLNVATEAGDLITTTTQPLFTEPGVTRPAGDLQPGDTLLRMGEDNIVRGVKVLSVTPTLRYEQVINLVIGNREAFLANGFLARGKPPL